MPLIPGAGRSLWVRGQPNLQSEFQDSQYCYTERPCLEKEKEKTEKKKEEGRTVEVEGGKERQIHVHLYLQYLAKQVSPHVPFQPLG